MAKSSKTTTQRTTKPKRTTAPKRTTKRKPAAANVTKPSTPPPAKNPPAQKKPQQKPQPIVSVTPGCCPKCQSTRRKKYSDVRTYPYPGTSDGRPYTHIVWRRTECASCGQKRIDRFCENRV